MAGPQTLKKQIEALGADPYSVRMWEKAAGFAVKVFNMPCGIANILKQEAIASGADAIVSRNTAFCKDEYTDALILGNKYGIRILSARLKRQPLGLRTLGESLLAMLEGNEAQSLLIKAETVPLERPLVMGILNVTPDSFSDGGSYTTEETIRARVEQIITEGAAFIDIGGVSTRPGHELPAPGEELDRVLPALAIASEAARGTGVYISLDSWRFEVIEKCIDRIDMINDQSGLEDKRLAELAAAHGCALCIMHRPAGPQDADISAYLADRAYAAEDAGLDSRSVLLDPGFGFGKNVDENYAALGRLPELLGLGYPVLAGVSRKSMIGAAVGREPAERTAGTLAAEVLAAQNGARVIRTHNVAACADAMKVFDLYKRNI